MIDFVSPRVVRPRYVGARQFVATTLFDRRYHVDTGGELSCAELGLTDTRSRWYRPTGVTRRRILPPREVSHDGVFIDFGSGKGRVALQAALQYRFQRVHGVELSERMHEIAERNVLMWHDGLRCRDVRLIRADAAEFRVPDDITIAFFYGPFVGEVFETVVRGLLASVDAHPRRLRIVFGNTIEEAALLRTGRVRPIRTLRGWRPSREWSRSNSFRLYEVTDHRNESTASPKPLRGGPHPLPARRVTDPAGLPEARPCHLGGRRRTARSVSGFHPRSSGPHAAQLWGLAMHTASQPVSPLPLAARAGARMSALGPDRWSWSSRVARVSPFARP